MRLKHLCLSLSFVLFLSGCQEPLRGIVFDDPISAAPIVLADADGDTFDISEHVGSVVLLYFGYTHCPDICPTTLADWASARRALGDEAEKVRFVFISMDPGRDTPRSAQMYAKQFHNSFIGLTGSDAAIDSLKAAWRIAAYPEGDPRTLTYTVAHPAHTFVVDRQGRLRVLYQPGTRGNELAQEIRKLL